MHWADFGMRHTSTLLMPAGLQHQQRTRSLSKGLNSFQFWFNLLCTSSCICRYFAASFCEKSFDPPLRERKSARSGRALLSATHFQLSAADNRKIGYLRVDFEACRPERDDKSRAQSLERDENFRGEHHDDKTPLSD
jgi:hypothetical protein